MPDRDAIDWRLYLILDPQALPEGRDPLQMADDCLAAGAGVLQLRDKRGARPDRQLACALLELCQQHQSLFVLNDDLELALQIGAPAVHLGPHDLPMEQARQKAPALILGGSAGTLERAQTLAAQGADYLGVGAIFEARASKADASAPRGTRALERITAALNMPIVGIGGITIENAHQVIKAGASGVAVIRAVCAADEPARACRALLEATS